MVCSSGELGSGIEAGPLSSVVGDSISLRLGEDHLLSLTADNFSVAPGSVSALLVFLTDVPPGPEVHSLQLKVIETTEVMSRNDSASGEPPITVATSSALE